jgi:hypothetical protein
MFDQVRADKTVSSSDQNALALQIHLSERVVIILEWQELKSCELGSIFSACLQKHPGLRLPAVAWIVKGRASVKAGHHAVDWKLRQ